MSDADWRESPDGRMNLFPVAGWDAAVLSGKAVGLRLHLIRTEADLAAGEIAYAPLLLTPTQALELAGALIRAARQVAPTPPAAL